MHPALPPESPQGGNGMTLAELGQELYDYVLRVAEGEETRNERYGIHDLAIFKRGVTL
jgi:altronate hydrolase